MHSDGWGMKDEFINGYNAFTGLYKSRYYANKYLRGDWVIVKVEGGFQGMSHEQYRNWRNQR